MTNDIKANKKYYPGEDIGLFIVLKDLGIRKNKLKPHFRPHIVEVKCKECGNIYEGDYGSFKTLHRTCECKKTPKFTAERKRIYHIHYGILSRCFDKDNHNYLYYGARGITICDEWKDSYESFYEWALKNGYHKNLTIERIDNNGNYEPSNCRWATAKEQTRNKKNVISIDKVREIKKLLKEGYTHNVIANMVNTSSDRVSNISKGRAWKDINY